MVMFYKNGTAPAEMKPPDCKWFKINAHLRHTRLYTKERKWKKKIAKCESLPYSLQSIAAIGITFMDFAHACIFVIQRKKKHTHYRLYTDARRK